MPSDAFTRARATLDSALDDFAENAGLPGELSKLRAAMKSFDTAAESRDDKQFEAYLYGERQCREDDAKEREA